MARVVVGFSSFLFFSLLVCSSNAAAGYGLCVGKRPREAKGTLVLEEAFVGFVLNLMGAVLCTISAHI